MIRYMIDGIIYDNADDARDAVIDPNGRVTQIHPDGSIDDIPAADIPSGDAQLAAYDADMMDTLYRDTNG